MSGSDISQFSLLPEYNIASFTSLKTDSICSYFESSVEQFNVSYWIIPKVCLYDLCLLYASFLGKKNIETQTVVIKKTTTKGIIFFFKMSPQINMFEQLYILKNHCKMFV